MTLEAVIRGLNPAPQATLVGPDSTEGRAIFDDVTRARAERRHRSRSRVLTLAALGGAVALGLGLFAIPGSPTRPNSAAAATLARLATVAKEQPATIAPGPGQYEYAETDEMYQDCVARSYCYFQPDRRQIWIGWDGSGRILETPGTPAFVAPSDHSAWVAAGRRPISTATSDTTFGPHTLSDGPIGFSNLPTDPARLSALLATAKLEGGSPGPANEFMQIGDLLRETDASPALRAALYQAAETIPGVIVLGTVADHDGQHGVGIARVNSAGIEHEYVFDPSTSALLGEDDVATRANAGGAGISAGTVLDWAVYLSSGIVRSLSETPTGTASPPPPVSCVAVTSGSIPGLIRAPGSTTYPAICKSVKP